MTVDLSAVRRQTAEALNIPVQWVTVLNQTLPDERLIVYVSPDGRGWKRFSETTPATERAELLRPTRLTCG